MNIKDIWMRLRWIERGTMTLGILAGVAICYWNIPAGLIFIIAVCIYFGTLSKYRGKGKERDEKGNFDRFVGNTIKGSCRPADVEERQKMFNEGTYKEQEDNIIGADMDDKSILYSYNRAGDSSVNGNVLIIGSPGSMKGVTYITNTILQTMRRKNQSLVVADSKGEAYARTSILARVMGMGVRLINFHPKTMIHSDAADYIGVIDSDVKALDFVNTIIENTSERMEFFDKSEANLLLATVMWHCKTPLAEGKKSLGEVYLDLITSSTDALKDRFAMLPDDSEVKPSAAIFENMTDRVADDTKAGLGIRLSIIGNRVLQKISGENEVDFTELGREPMIYYVASSDHSSTLDFMQALFFTLLIGELTDFADFSTREEKLPVPVHFLLDEFRNIGRIPNFERIIATARGRGIDFSIVIQVLNQLQNMYPEEWEGIMDSFSLWILLKTNTKTTAEYFEWRGGIEQVQNRSIAYTESNLKPFNEMIDEYRVTITTESKPCFPSYEIARMEPSVELVCPSGHNACYLRKVPYWEHPMAKALVKTNVRDHVPNWVREMLKNKDDYEDELEKFEIEYDEWIELLKKDQEMYKKAMELKEEIDYDSLPD